jgi:hypothetical protein
VHPERQVSQVDRPDSNCHHVYYVVLCYYIILCYVILYYYLSKRLYIFFKQLDSDKGKVYHDCNND